MKARLALLAVLAAALAGRVLADQTPFDGYAFWLPCGTLTLGDAKSEKEFQVKRSGNEISFVVHPRHTRFDVPKGQLVIVIDALPPEAGLAYPGVCTYKCGSASGDLGGVQFLPRQAGDGKGAVTIAIKPRWRRPGAAFRFYWTDDSDKLGTDLATARPPAGPVTYITEHAPIRIGREHTGSPGGYYVSAAEYLMDGNPAQARDTFVALARAFKTPEAQRLCRRMVRWCDAEMQFKKIRSGPGYYDLGLYCMVNGFWELAEGSFRKATQKMPKDPNAAYMLANAVAYVISDLDTRMELVYPYYKKAAELYRRPNYNTFRTYFGLFRNLKLKEGDHTVVKHITDEEIAYVEKAWAWCSAIMEGASHGALRMVNTFKVYDKEFDGTDDWNPRPFDGLFKPYTVDTFIKMTDWGASDTCGMDCGPDRSAFINLGIREWDVMLHEWNHSLDWEMVSTEQGIGVPETHASDWCGYEPIPSMGMGHHSINRYYMTPGMFQYIRGADAPTTPFLTDWAVAGPYKLMDDAADPTKINDAYNTLVQQKAQAVTPPQIETLKTKPRVDAGYVDIEAGWPNAPHNAYAFAKTYVYSPKTQKVRAWLAADHNIRVWLNGKLVHKGFYWCCAQFLGAKMKDQLACSMLLQKGWNSLEVQVTSCQHAPDGQTGKLPPDQWGFSVRLCDYLNRAVPGLRSQAAKPAGFKTPVDLVVNPKRPKTYAWRTVADDYTTLLPALTPADLRSITGYSTLNVTNDMFFDLSHEKLDARAAQIAVPKADPKNVALNNELNWFFSPKEDAAVVRFKRGGRMRDLLFLRPEGYEPFLRMMRLTPEASACGIRSHADQVIGYFTVPCPGCANGRIVLVVDTYLGDKLPTDEEDLLDIHALR